MSERMQRILVVVVCATEWWLKKEERFVLISVDKSGLAVRGKS
jgi:hypothetical protein